MHQLDLAAFDEIDRIVLITSDVDFVITRNLNSAATKRLALQRIAQLMLELVRLRCFVNPHCYTLGQYKVQILLLEKPAYR